MIPPAAARRRFRPLRAALPWLAALVVLASTLLHVPLLLLAALAKALLRVRAWQPALDRVLVGIAESWIGFNSRLIDVFTGTRFEV